MATFTLPEGAGKAANDIDLAADQCTLAYSVVQRGVIARYDVCQQLVLPALATLPATTSPTGRIRFLPDGSLLVATAGTAARVLRIDTNGAIVQSFTVPGAEYWQSVALDLGASSFIASGDRGTYRFYLADPARRDRLTDRDAAAMAVVGEPRAALGAASVPASSFAALLLTACLLAAAGIVMSGRF